MDEQDQDNEDGFVPRTPPVTQRPAPHPHSPMQAERLPSTILLEHDRTSVHDYLRQDLKVAKGVKLDVFVEVLLGLTPDIFNNWVLGICKQKWYKDQVIADGLKTFCAASTEAQRYDPLANIANRVMEMAHGNLPGVPNAYPIDDICVVRNDPTALQTIEAHGDLGAVRRPDLLTIRKVHAVNLESRGRGVGPVGLKWVQDIVNWEVKGQKSLSEMLNEFLKDRRRRVNRKKGKAPLGDNAGMPSSAIPAVRAVRVAKGPKAARAPKAPVRRQPARHAKRQRLDEPTFAPAVCPPVEPTVAPAPCSVDEPSVAPAVCSTTDPAHAGVQLPVERNLLNDLRKSDPHVDIERLMSTDASSFAAKEASIQAGSYALETMACSFGTRLHCINVCVENDRMFFWYYDACGFICTVEGISLVADFEKAAAIIIGLACCTPERLGALPSLFKPPPSGRYPRKWPPENLSNYTLTLQRPDIPNGIKVTLQDSVFTQYALSGRRTFVYTIKKIPALSKQELIIKLSYQVKTRKTEQEIVDIARTAGVGHLPEIHLSGDLWKMSDGVRRAFFDKAGVEYEDRTLRAIVYTRYLPLQALFPHSPESIPLMAYQIIECLFDLREKANILHRDVSLHNVMHYYRDGELYFVLIDFDMATVVDEKTPYTPSSKHRTGTLPFMAIELIDNASTADRKHYVAIPHVVRHDVESVFWLSLWCVMVLMVPTDDSEKEDKRKNVAIARAWETATLEQIADKKARLLAQPLLKSGIVFLGKSRCLDMWFFEWVQFWNGVHAALSKYAFEAMAADFGRRSPPVFDYETANGLFTRDKLMRVLTSEWPDPRSKAGKATGSGNESTGPSGFCVAEDVVTEDTVGQSRKATAPTKKSTARSRKAKTTKKSSTARTKAAAEKAKATIGKAATKVRKARATAKSTEQEAEVGEDNDIRRRLRPRKRL